MNDEVYKKLQETSWRRELTPEEESQLRAFFVAHPATQEQWEDEAFLNHQLERLPNAPLSSNFTAQVLRNLDLDLAREERESRATARLPWWRRWLPRCATAGVLGCIAAAAGFQYHQGQQRSQLVQRALKVAPLASVPAPDIFKDFEAIRQLRHVSAPSDDALLAALQVQ